MRSIAGQKPEDAAFARATIGEGTSNELDKLYGQRETD